MSKIRTSNLHKLDGLFVFLVGAAVLRLIHAAWIDSMDFTVYWKAVQSWVHGHSPYVYSGTERGFVFKYPPWILPFFAPFGLLPFGASKILWALIELFCLIFSLNWVRDNGVSWRRTLVFAFLFWWIWLGHFYAGQFTLMILAAGLWAVSPRKSSENTLQTSILGLAFSTKVFSAVSLLGIWRRFARGQVVGSLLALAGGGTLVAWLLLRIQGDSTGFFQLISDWTKAAASGGSELGAQFVRGQMNHSFTAGILRLLGVESTAVRADIAVTAILSVVLAPTWAYFSRKLEAREKWAGWLALGVIVHPLAWHHSFVLTFPLCALSMDRALNSGKKDLIALSFLGTFLIGLLIPNIFGLALVTPFENLSVKSWGVCLSALSLVRGATGRKTGGTL